MDEALLIFGPAILAVGVAVFLRMRRNRREASEEIIALGKKVAALEQRTRDFELERRLSELRVRCSVPAESSPNMESDRPQPVPLAATPKEPAFAQMLAREKELARIERCLYALKSILPEDIYLGQKYVAEFDSILSLVERESGSTLDRFRISAPCKRSIFRLSILALLGFCDYHLYHSPLPRGFVPAPPEAADRIH
jgi:hypothetical protein